MPVDPTAFTRVPSPGILQGTNMGLQGIQQQQAQNRADRYANIAEAQESRVASAYAESQDAKTIADETFKAWKSGDKKGFQLGIGKLATKDPEAAKQLATIFGSVDRTNFVEGAYHIYNAARLDDTEAVNKSLQRAAEAFNVTVEHPFHKEMLDIAALPEGEEKTERIMWALNLAKRWGAFGDTDEDLEREKLRISQGNLMARWQEIAMAQDREGRIKQQQEFENLYGATPDDFYRSKEDPSRLMVKPGSKTWEARQADKKKLLALYSENLVKGDRLIKQLDKAVGEADWTTSGFIGNFLKYIPGFKAKDLQETIKTIKANIGFDKLQDMRLQSPTGGALGQVAVQELEALQASIASMEQSQSPTQLKENLGLVLDHYRRFLSEASKNKGRIEQADINNLYTMEDFENKTWEKSSASEAAVPAAKETPTQYSSTNPARPTTDEEYAKLKKGDYYIDPDDNQLYIK